MAKAKAVADAVQPISLFEIGSEFLELEAAMRANGGEWTEEMEQRFGSVEALEQAHTKKADGYVALLQRSELNEAAIKAQAAWHDGQSKALKAQAKTEENFRDRLKARLIEHMWRLDVRELAGSIWKVARHKNGGTRKVVVNVPTEQLPEGFRRWVPPTEGRWEANDEAIRDHLRQYEALLEARDAGQPINVRPNVLDGMAELEPQGEHIKIV
jgi:hypothetical protein